MNKRFLGAIAVTALAVASWAIWADASDKDKQASAQAECAAHGKMTSASTANMSGECAAHGKMTSASTASTSGECAAHGKMTSASAAGMDACCAGNMKGAMASKGHEACAPGSIGAGMIGAPSCPHGGSSASLAEMKGDCDACADMVTCSSEMSASSAQTQAVPLRNGVMFVYTTDTPAHVRAVQNAVARRGDRLVSLAQSGDRAKLCPECRSARGAIASGKLTRETVNIEGGCMTLVTSSDPAMVAKLRAMAAISNGRNKS